jgi:hypothetical protein
MACSSTHVNQPRQQPQRNLQRGRKTYGEVVCRHLIGGFGMLLDPVPMEAQLAQQEQMAGRQCLQNARYDGAERIRCSRPCA